MGERLQAQLFCGKGIFAGLHLGFPGHCAIRAVRCEVFLFGLFFRLQDEPRRFGEFQIFHGDDDFGHAQGRALGCTVENAISHAFRAQGLVALFAQHPANGVHDVGFPAAIRPDDAGAAHSAERDHGPLAEGLEPYNFHFSELKQGVPFCRELPLRGLP